MRSIRTPLIAALLLGTLLPAFAQPTDERPLPPPGDGERLFGFEFEFAGNGNRVVHFEEMPWENYRSLMRVIVEHYGGNPEHIRKIDFVKPTSNIERYPSGERNLFRAEWVDPRGRKWMIEPEYVATTGYDGYELVTPPIDDPRDLKNLLEKINSSGLVREGLKSGVHLNIDGRRLVTEGGDARALANLIMMHENMEPMLRRLFNPVRGGGHANRFSRSLAVDHEDLLKEIDRLPPEARTRENLERLFAAREGREAALHEVDPLDPETRTKMWKYRAMNLAKVLNVNPMHNGNLGVVEFRMFDLDALKNPEVHRLEAELYRRMVRHAEELAARGETVRYQPRAAMPAGDDPSVYNTSEDPAEAKREARRMVESLGLNAAEFEPLINERIQPRVLRTEGEFRGLLDRIPDARRTHNGAPFTFGFELEGKGNGLTGIMRPTDAETDARWDSMSKPERKAYFDRVVGNNHSSVDSHFKPDPRLWWLDPYWYVEGTGNWEIHSKVFESVEEVIRGMREAKKLTETSGKGFHLHMRDNAPDWEMLRTRGSNFADWIERASNWVWLERARRLGTMTSLKSWSNARMSSADVENLSNLSNTSRATIRTQISNPNYIDIEIRGFTKYVDDIETLAKLTTEALKTGNFGPWRHTDNVLPNGGRGVHENNRLVDYVEKYVTEVEGKEMTPEMRKVVEGMQGDYLKRPGVDARTLPTNLGAPLLPWEGEASLPEDVRRALVYERENYVRKVATMAREIADGTRYGLDLEVASETAMAERLGLSPEAARGLVAFRRARGGSLTAEEAVRAVAAGEDMERLSRLEEFKLNEGEAENVRNRFNLSEAEANRIVELARSHDVLEALERAGVSENRILEMVDNTAEVDLATTDMDAERLARRLGISEEAARRILAYRAGHEINGADDVRAAGLEEARAREITELSGRTTDLRSADAEELRRMGLNDHEIETLTSGREANTLRRYNDLDRAGISSSVREALRTNNGINLAHLNTLSAEEIASRSGISLEDANKIVRHRTALDVSNAEVLTELLGADRAEAVRTRATGGMNLNTATEAEMRAAGLSEVEADRIVRHRGETRIGYPSGTYGSFSADRAGTELLEAGLVSEAEAESIRRRATSSNLETANAETLAERFGLDAERARRVIAYRDALDMNNVENLREAGLSEAEAERVLRESRELDPRASSRAELRARTGLNDVAIDRLLAVRGTDLSAINAEGLAERTGISVEDARRLVEHRDAHTFEEAMDRIGLSDRLGEIRTRTVGADPLDAELSEAEIAERLGISAEELLRIKTYAEAHEINGEADLRTAGLSEEDARRVMSFTDAVNLETASLEDLRRLGLSEEEARRVVDARTGHSFRGYNDLRASGVEAETIEALRRNRNINMDKLGSLSASELASRGGISAEEAGRIVAYRDATVTSESSLRSLVGEEAANRVSTRAAGIDGTSATRENLVRAFGEEVGNRIANYRDAHDMRSGYRRAFDANDGASELLKNRVVSEEVAERIRSRGRALDIETATTEALTGERVGLSAEEAARVIELRSRNNISEVDALVERGVDRATAERILETTQPFNIMEASVEELVRRGMNESEARRIVEFRDKAKNVEGLDLKEIERQIRYKVKLWARNTGLSEALRRSLLPRTNELNPVVDTPENRAEGRYTESTNANSEGEGFSRVRRGAAGEVAESRISTDEVRGIFDNVRESSINRTLARMTDPGTSAAERASLERGMRNLRGLGLEVVSSNDILAEYAGNKVRVSTGLLNEIDARVAAMPADARGFMRARILGLIMAHETSHSAGIRGERVADAEAIGILEGSGLSRIGETALAISNPEIRAAVEAFDKPLGSSHVDNFLTRMRNLVRYGTTRGRIENMERAARGEADKYARYRRVDGTLRWGKMTADGVLKTGVGGTAHFALALFLKEVATVAATGDKARIEEFFDGLMTTDFYVHYGLFVAGARVGDVAYVRYLQKYVKPKFINGLLRTNLTLAAGLALPMIVEGNFNGKAFVITLGSLGLSTAAVRAGVKSIRWVSSLANARRTGSLARFGLRAGKLANVAGWIYTAAELAVILYVAEKIEHRVNEALDLAKARGELADAGREWTAALNDPNASVDSVREANQKYHEAWIGYRNYLYTPLEMDEALYASRLAKLARTAKIKADEREAALERIRGRAALRASIERRYGSLEKYAESLTKRDEDAIREDLETYSTSYNTNREKHLAEVYNDHRRGTDILDGVEHLEWNLAGGATGTDGDPLSGRSDVFANWSRDRVRSSFGDALGNASRNRLEAYEDEADILKAAAESLRARGNDAFAALLDENLDIVNTTLVMDRNLANGNPAIDTGAIRAGAVANSSATGEEGLGSRVEGAVSGDE